MSADKSARILIVDDDTTSRLVISAQLKVFGYRLFEACNGEEAIERFRQDSPDIVLMDVNMPGMDGYEATRIIKESSHEDYVPVLFITAMDEESVISRCANAGGDDFLVKPLTPVILDARIRAALQRRQLYRTIQEQHQTLELRRIHDEREQELAKELFSRIAHLGCLDELGVDYLASSLMVFNGDLLLAERTPYGALRIMLGDFTGHGLPAAVGSLPVAEIFYGMTKKGFHISELAAEINSKLWRILPKGIFCAAALIELNSETRQLAVWNGGLPHILLFDKEENKVRKVFNSLHLALGILGPDSFDASLEHTPVSVSDTLIAYSDGIVETENPAGDLYGDHRLIECLNAGHHETSIFQLLMDDLTSFREHAAQSDDLTLIELPCGLENRVARSEDKSKISDKPATEWKYHLTLLDEALSTVDPVPLLIQSLIHIQGLESVREDLFTILTELYINALDHGVLKLNSEIKHDAKGFAEYFRLREEGLQSVEGGSVAISMRHTPVDKGGRLLVRIEDSGDGFDIEAITGNSLESTEFSGRGISLVKNLCDSLTYSNGGCVVEAVFEWS